MSPALSQPDVRSCQGINPITSCLASQPCPHLIGGATTVTTTVTNTVTTTVNYSVYTSVPTIVTTTVTTTVTAL